jgi:hypothetical protein
MNHVKPNTTQCRQSALSLMLKQMAQSVTLRFRVEAHKIGHEEFDKYWAKGYSPKKKNLVKDKNYPASGYKRFWNGNTESCL